MAEKYSSSPYTRGVNSVAFDAAAVTPADTDLPKAARALYVGGAGDVAVIMLAGDQQTVVTFVAVVAGSILPIGVLQVRGATTATDIVALFD